MTKYFENEDGEVTHVLEKGKWKPIPKAEAESKLSEYTGGLISDRPNPMVEAALQGATAGFSDELQGLLGGPAVKAQAREAMAQAQEEHPIASTAAMVGGGLATGGLGASRAFGSQFGRMHPLLTGSAVGAGTGAVAGAGFAETMEDVPSQMLQGGVLGMALPPALQGMGMLGKGLTAPIGKALSQRAKFGIGPSGTANRMIYQNLLRDDATDILEKAGRYGPEAKLVDVGGENLKRLAQNITSMPGKAPKLAEEVLQGRMMKSPERLIESLQKLTSGAKIGAHQLKKQIKQVRKAEAGPLYNEAFKVDREINRNNVLDVINYIDQKGFDPDTKGIGKVLNEVKNSLISKRQAYSYLRTGTTQAPKTNLSQLHSAKMELDQKIQKSFYEHKPTKLTRELMGVKKRLLNAMDASDNYAQARKIWADESAVDNAVDLGKKILRTDAEDMADFFEVMSHSEKEGFVTGAVKAITDKFKGTTEGANAARKIATPLVKERIKQAIPDEEMYQRFMASLDAEDVFAESRNILRGSQTQQRTSTAQEILGEGAGAASIWGFKAGLLNMTRKFMGGLGGIPEPVRDRLGEKLFVDSVLGKPSQKLLKELKKHGIRKERVDRFFDVLKAGTAIGSGELGAQ